MDELPTTTHESQKILQNETPQPTIENRRTAGVYAPPSSEDEISSPHIEEVIQQGLTPLAPEM